MKNTVFMGLFLLLAGSANADPRDDALSAVLRCSGTSDKAQRLACYDSAAVRVPGALRAPSPPPVAVATAAAPAPVVRRRRSSGFLDSIFGPGGPNRAPQTSAGQFG